MDAIAEHNDAASQVSNQESLAKRLLKRTTKARAGSAKLNAPKKRRIYESGISENVTSGEGMVDVLESFGPAYDPINISHTTISLTDLNVQGRDILNEVRDVRQQKSDDINVRKVLFATLNKKFSMVYNQLVACGAPEGTIENAKGILDDMRGKRKGKPKPGAKIISISHLSRSQMVEHVSNFLVLLANCPEYDSNNPDLKLLALEDYRDSLIAGNADVSSSKATWKTSLIDRNKFFNEKNKGFIDTFESAKKSVKAIFGANSAQFHQVAQFKFRRIRD